LNLHADFCGTPAGSPATVALLLRARSEKSQRRFAAAGLARRALNHAAIAAGPLAPTSKSVLNAWFVRFELDQIGGERGKSGIIQFRWRSCR